MAERFKFRYVNEFIGGFVILVAILAAVSVFVVAHSQKWFARNYELSVLLPESGSHGLRKGAEVLLLGAVAGQVRRIAIDADDRMIAQIRIRSDFFRFVRDDSAAVIRKKFGLVAEDAYLDITRGKGAALPKKNAMIPSTVEKSIFTTIEETLVRMENATLNAVEQYGELAANLRNPHGPLQLLLARMNRFSESLEAGEGIAAKLLTDKSMAADFERTLSGVNTVLSELKVVLLDAQKTSGKIAQLTDNVGEQLAAMPRLTSMTEKVLQETEVVLKDIHKTMDSFPDIVGRLDQEMQSLPGLMIQTQETLRQIEKLVIGMQKHWMLRDYVEQARPTTRIPSAEVGSERKRP
jgi:phospholipid/cholesterol/gamma-HCH transport system substrate-binding protein